MRVEELPVPEQVKRLLLEEGIEELYPPQEDAIKAGALDGRNLVLASPTASGKTLVAELCAAKHVLELGGKVVYLTPLRALASEKYRDFSKYASLTKPNGQRVSVAVSTGDYDSEDPWLQRYDIIVLTNEKCDSLLRHRVPWVEDVTLVVADEVHLINDATRGPTLEVVLARLRQINPKAQILALSATIRNAEEIAEWLDAGCVTTAWRPVPLREGVYYRGRVEFGDGGSARIEERVKDPVMNLVDYGLRQGGQVLVFCETRRAAVDAAKRAAAIAREHLDESGRKLAAVAQEILARGERTRVSELLAQLVQNGAAFHHAGLSSSHRRLVEDAFRSGWIKVVAATPTLAAGVNLPARLVVVSSYVRYEPGYGRYPITVLEYKQMAGRAGRPRYDPVGEALLVAKRSDELEFLLESYVLAAPERIWSKLGAENVLRSHVLATIASGYADSLKGVLEFFGKTLYAMQYSAEGMRRAIQQVVEFLAREDLVQPDVDKLYPTPFGKRVSELYIDPISAVVIRDALERGAKLVTEVSFLHLICHTPDLSPPLYPRRKELKNLIPFLEDHRYELFFEVPEEWEDPVGYERFLAEIKGAMVLESWINEVSEDALIERFGIEPGDLFRLVEMADWLLSAVYELAKLFRKHQYLPKVLELRDRVRSGIKPELLPLVRIEGVGRVRARSLYNAGYKTIEDLRRADVDDLTKVPFIGPTLAKRLKEAVEKGLEAPRAVFSHLAEEELPQEEGVQAKLTEFS